MIVDMHCHVVYGVDDGAQKPGDMQDMLRLAHENRVKHIICTSHIAPGEAPFPAEKYEAHLAEGQAYCDSQGWDLHLHPGSEILYTRDAVRMLDEGRVPRLDGKWAVLVEFWHECPYSTMEEAARKLTDEGMTVVFAHIERYKALGSIRRIRDLKERWGILMQMNSHTVTRKLPFFTERWKQRVLRDGLVDIISSDAHNITSRSCTMLPAWEKLRDTLGEERADDLCGGCIARVLELT